jgi:hypothetical protein
MNGQSFCPRLKKKIAAAENISWVRKIRKEEKIDTLEI